MAVATKAGLFSHLFQRFFFFLGVEKQWWVGGRDALQDHFLAEKSLEFKTLNDQVLWNI